MRTPCWVRMRRLHALSGMGFSLMRSEGDTVAVPVVHILPDLEYGSPENFSTGPARCLPPTRGAGGAQSTTVTRGRPRSCPWLFANTK